MLSNFIFNRKIISIFAFVLLLVVFWYSVRMQAVFYDTLFYLETYFRGHQILGIFVFVGLAAVSSLLSPFSSVPLVPIAIVMWGGVLATIFLISGWILGHIGSYTIGYYAGHPIAKRFIPFDKINDYSKKLSKKSEFLLILFFRLSTPAEVPGYVLGTIRYDFWKYLLATFIAEFPFAALTVYGGEALIEKDLPVLISVVVIGASMIISMLYLFRKKINAKQ